MAKSPSAAGPKRPAQTHAKTAPARPRRTPWLEWVAAGIGLALTASVVGVIGREALMGDSSAPAIELKAMGVEKTATGYVLTFKATNVGGRPAAQVLVEGELAVAGAEPETAEATFDYVPDQSSRIGGLFFKADPSSGAVTLSSRGFVEP